MIPPTTTPATFEEARDLLVVLCDRYATSAADEPHAYYDAELEYVDDMILDVARIMVRLA